MTTQVPPAHASQTSPDGRSPAGPDVVTYVRTVAAARAKSADQLWAAAAPLWERAAVRNPLNGNAWDRLAEARYENEDFRGALEAYEKAREFGVRWGPDETESSFRGVLAYRIACCHARLGRSDEAIDWLARAVQEGLRDLDWPTSDPTWDQLLADERVRNILGIIDHEGLSRTDGWRSDLWFFARELERRAYAPFGQVSAAEFDARISKLAQQADDMPDAQIMAELMRLLVPLADGHAWVSPPDGRDELRLTVPLKFYDFQEGVFITAAEPRYARLTGARVIAAGGHPIDAILTALEQVISRDNAQQVRWQRPEFLRWTTILHALGLISDPARLSLTLEFPGGAREGAREEVTVDASPAAPPDSQAGSRPARALRPRPTGWVSLPDTLPEPLPLCLRNCELPYWFEYLREHGLVYLQLNGVEDHPAESMADFCSRVFAFIDTHPVERLVIDLRWNPGGNTFLTQQLLHHLIGCPVINQRGSLFVIIGRAMFSAAQNTATAIERETKAIFVGEPSGSRPNFIGESIPFDLPYSKMKVNISDLYWQTSHPMDSRPWIAPDIYAPPTFAAYRRNADPALDAILAVTEHLPGS
jgi:hypothetical protein